jgi:hypothetical protein
MARTLRTPAMKLSRPTTIAPLRVRDDFADLNAVHRHGSCNPLAREKADRFELKL